MSALTKINISNKNSSIDYKNTTFNLFAIKDAAIKILKIAAVILISPAILYLAILKIPQVLSLLHRTIIAHISTLSFKIFQKIADSINSVLTIVTIKI